MSLPCRTTLSTTTRLPTCARSMAALKYPGRVALVRVDEDEVEGLALLGLERRETVERGADPDLDLAVEAGASDVGASHVRRGAARARG